MNHGTRTVALSGDDTTNIAGRVLTDQANGDVTKLSLPNKMGKVTNGKNGNAIFSFNATGLQCEVEVRVIRGSADDKFLNGIVQAWKSNPPAFRPLQGEFVKRIGNGNGVAWDTYQLSGGIPTNGVPALENVEGAEEQCVAVYLFEFSNFDRSLQ